MSAGLLIGLFALSSFIWLTSAKENNFAESKPNATIAKTVTGFKQTATIKAEERGTSRLKFQDGRDVEMRSLGEANLAQAAPLALAAGDFNSDGYEDIIGGYATDEGGVITLYRTNRDAIAPSTEKIHTEMMNGRFPAPILPDAVSFAVPEKADFVGVGDFNRDGYKDVLTAARGSFNLHLVAGDGRGGFKYQERVELPAPVTALLADDVNNYDSMPDAIVGVGGNGYAPKALIFHNKLEMFSDQPAEIDLPSEATAFAVGQMDGDVFKDLVVAAGYEVVIARGYDQLAGKKPDFAIERISLASPALSVATGEFLFDREARTEIAVLTKDGAVNLAARGNVDRRPYTDEEQKTILEKRRQRDDDGLTAFKKAIVKRNGSNAWAIAETPINAGDGAGASAKLMAAPLAGMSTDDLIVVGSGNNSMRLVQTSKNGFDSLASVAELAVENGAVAAVPLRLNSDTVPDIAVLRQGEAAPTALLSPTASINVTTTADVIANNGQCSLREATINANNDNQSGSTDCAAGSGADTINVPAGTYTLTIGPFDSDEFLDGYRPESGDLDIADGNGSGGAIGDVTITGVAGSTIIQAGTTTTNGIDRVFDVNSAFSFGVAVNATFTNLIIQHGKATRGDFGYNFAGGGIQFDAFDAFVGGDGRTNKTLGLNSTTVTLNRAAGQGGGILAINGAVNFTNSTISSNSVVETRDLGAGNLWTNGAGGGMSYDGGGTSGTPRTVQMTNTTFSGNFTSDPEAGVTINTGPGGAARLAGGTGATISGLTLTNNDASTYGGGFSIDTIPAISISNSTITGNDAKTNGGGIFSKPIFASGTLSTLTMTGNTINNNRADVDNNATGATVDGDGGGIFQERGNLTLSGGTIGGSGTANTAFNGGGIAHRYEGAPTASIINNSTMTIDNVTISFNTARSDGGGFYNNSANQTTNSIVNLGSTTNVNLLSNNANVNGGGISNINSGTANLTRATVRSNNADNDNNNSGNGGGLFNGATATLTANAIIGGIGAGEGNSAVNGGGIHSTGQITVTGSPVNGNTADTNGGGIFNSGNNFTVSGATINNNTATSGKGDGIEHTGTSGSVTTSTLQNNAGSGINISGAGSLDVSGSTITNNTGDGITKIGTGTGSHFNSNVIHSNGELGIDLGDNAVTANDAGDGDTGPNNLQNYPVLNYVRRGNGTAGIASVTLNSAPGKYRIQYYANTACDASGHGEGEVLLAATEEITVPAGGTLTFLSAVALPYGTREQITATATSNPNGDSNYDDGSTSEFSACRKVNTLPTFSAVQTPLRQQGSPASNSQIVTVTDPDQALNTLAVTVNGGASATVNGVTVSNIAVDASGNVTADIVASCNATNASFTLRVTDSATEFNEITLNVIVTPNTPPTLGNYPNTTVNAGSSGGVVTPDAAPTDNGTVATLTAAAPGFTGTFVGNATTGTVTVNSAAPAGVYTVTVTATDNCGATSTTTFQLTVNAIPTITGATISRQQGSPSANSQIATVNDADQSEETLVVTVNGGASATVNGVTVSNIAVDASGNVTADVVASCTATNATFTLTVTDSVGASSNATLTVNVTPNTPPTVGTYSATNLPSGGGTTVTPSAAPGDNGSIMGASATASGAFTGTLSVNSATGVVTISNANPGGSFTVSVTFTDNCGATTTEQFTLNVTLSISGTVSYGIIQANQAQKKVPDVLLSVTGAPTVSDTTDSMGFYQLDGLTAGGNYTVTPTKTTDANGISPFDATMILRHVASGGVGPNALSPDQQIAADTNGDGNITPFDATLVLRYVVAMGPTANTGQVGTWKFVPPSTNYNPLSSSQSNQNYTAYLIGEVDGSWAPSNPPNSNVEADKQETAFVTNESSSSVPAEAPAFVRDRQELISRSGKTKESTSAEVQLLLPANSSAPNGSVVSIPVWLNNDSNKRISSFKFAVRFDPNVLQPEQTAIEATDSLIGNGFMVVSDTATAGRLGVAATSLNNAVSDSGALVYLRFRVVGANNDSASALNFETTSQEGGTFEDNFGNKVSSAAANGSFAPFAQKNSAKR
ncbi:MAG TPA: dockerin type I domain-containing protein [Pyrinomonadaceae bacterium]